MDSRRVGVIQGRLGNYGLHPVRLVDRGGGGGRAVLRKLSPRLSASELHPGETENSLLPWRKAMAQAALAQDPAVVGGPTSGPWLWSRKFDLTFLLLPGLLVAVPPLLHMLLVGLGVNPVISRNLFNVLIGGVI